VNAPLGVTLDSSGILYILESCVSCQGNYIRKVSSGAISTVAGNYPPCGADVPADAVNVASDSSGNACFAFPNDHRILELSNGATATVSGEGGNPGYSEDGGPATKAQLNGPLGVAVDSSGNLNIAERRWLHGEPSTRYS
jgi:hypothetical protein